VLLGKCIGKDVISETTGEGGAWIGWMRKDEMLRSFAFANWALTVDR